MYDITHEIKKIKKEENGCTYKITLSVPMSLGFIKDVFIEIDGMNYKLNYTKKDEISAFFENNIYLKEKSIYHYYFTFKANDQNMKYGENLKLGVNFNVPNWAKGKIMYHIFIDRFNRVEVPREIEGRKVHQNWNEDVIIGPDENGMWNTDYYGGSLKGIIEKLDYIKDLGVSIIYLSPIPKSQSNHRYDTANYEEIDPYVGTEEDLKKLCEKAHQKGIKIVLDAVFNHTGNDSIYFNEYGNYNTLGAYQSEKSPYYDFYRKNNNEFEYWWGMKNLPVCDGNSKHWQDYIYGQDGIIDKWFNLGIDGLRLDVADELTDEFIEGIRDAVKRNKEDGFILGEVWKNPMRMNRTYISSGKAMDSVMNYLLVDSLIRYFKYADVNKIKDVLNQINYEYPKETIESLMNFTSTHDISRIINIFSSDRFKKDGEWAWNLKDENYENSKNFKLKGEDYFRGMKIYKSYIFTLAFLPGNLSIFYGDEIGMEGEGNLSNRKPFTWNKIDNNLLNYFKYIGKIRKKEKFLETANLKILEINDKIMMFERDDKLLTVINRSNEDIIVYLPEEYNDKPKTYSINKTNRNILSSYNGFSIKK